MRSILTALALLATVSTATAQLIPSTEGTHQLFLKSKPIEVPSAERLDGNIAACRKVAVRDQMSCRADMTKQRDDWAELVKLAADDEQKDKAWSLYVTILERDYLIRREWAEVVGWK